MRIKLLIDNGRLGGVSLTGAAAKPVAGGLSAHLVAGPGQELREVEVPGDVIPRAGTTRDVEKFFRYLMSNFVKATKPPRPRNRTR